MKDADQVIECPCFRVCAGLGLEMKRWCRYRKSDLPPPGMWWVRPKEDWCPAGVQAGVLMLGYMLSGGRGDPEQLKPVVDQVRTWARELRRRPVGYDPAGSNQD